MPAAGPIAGRRNSPVPAHRPPSAPAGIADGEQAVGPASHAIKEQRLARPR